MSLQSSLKSATQYPSSEIHSRTRRKGVRESAERVRQKKNPNCLIVVTWFSSVFTNASSVSWNSVRLNIASWLRLGTKLETRLTKLPRSSTQSRSEERRVGKECR